MSMRINIGRWVLVALLFPGATARAEWVEWLADSRVAARFDDNINTTFISAQALDEYVWSGRMSGGRAYQLDDRTRAYLTAQISGDAHHRYENLDQYAVGGHVLLTHKFGLGWHAPALSVGGSADRLFSASALRSGERAQGQIRLSQWLHHDVLQAQIGYRYDYRDGANLTQPEQDEHPELADKSGAVFDIDGHTVETLWNLNLSERLRFNAGYGWRWGDITSNNLLTGVRWRGANVLAIQKDDALPGWIYRAYGTSQTWDAGLSYSFMDGHAITSLGYRHVDTEAIDHSYAVNQAHLSVSFTY